MTKPASGASGKSAGFISRNWTDVPTASLEDLSFRLHQGLARQFGGAEKWGYRPCRVLAVVGGTRDNSEDLRWSERHEKARKRIFRDYPRSWDWKSVE